jgi:hypothetical protein
VAAAAREDVTAASGDLDVEARVGSPAPPPPRLRSLLHPLAT